MEYIGLKHRPTFMYDYLKPLLEKDKLQMTIPDKQKKQKSKICNDFTKIIIYDIIYLVLILGGNIMRSKENFLKSIDARDFQHEEVIDGVRVVHTGLTNYVYEYDVKGHAEAKPKEILEMYDVNGNRFYSNCSSLEEAQKLVERLKAEGKNAVIGPKAPWMNKDGQPIKNQSENAVGVYIVKEKEDKELGKDEDVQIKQKKTRTILVFFYFIAIY